MRILLVDDHAMMRDGLRAILEKHGLEVVGDAGSGRAAIAIARRARPDVVVMDLSMPDLNGIDATRRLVAERRGARIVGLSIHAARRYVLAMFEAGASGYVLKRSAASELVVAVEAVAAGGVYVSPSIAGIVLEQAIGPTTTATKAPSSRPPPGAEKPLSPREREVLQLLAEGRSSKEIANRLGLSVATIETHRRQIMAKVKLRSIAELTKYAIREGITPLEP